MTADMESENKLHAGDVQGQPSQYPPQYTPASQQQHQQQQGSWGGHIQQYPQYGPPSTAATPLYAAPPGGGYGAVPSGQQRVIVVATPVSPVIRVEPVESFVGAIIYSCIVCWCCNLIFGLIGFVLACEYMLTYSTVCFLIRFGKTRTTDKRKVIHFYKKIYTVYWFLFLSILCFNIFNIFEALSALKADTH